MEYLLEELDNLVTQQYNVDIKARSRKKEYVDARFVFCYIARFLFKITFQKIGDYLNRNHASIINYVSKFEGYIRTDIELKKNYLIVNEICVGKLDGYLNSVKKMSVINQINYHKEKIKSLESLLN